MSVDQLLREHRNLLGLAQRMRDPLPRPVVEACAKIGLSDVRKHFQESKGPQGPWPPVYGRIRLGGTAKPLLDTGKMRASLQTRVEGNSYFIGTNAVQAAAHNFGAVIRAKNSKYLAIPLTLEAMRAGSPRRFPRPLDVQIWRDKTGGVMFEWPVTRRRGRIENLESVDHYLLTKSVTIPKREFLWISPEADKRIARVVFVYIWTGK